MHESGVNIINAMTSPDLTLNTNPAFQAYADEHGINGYIYSALDKQESALLYINGDGTGHGSPVPASDLTCYYKLDDGINEPMYVKLDAHDEVYAVPSIAMMDIDKPYNDKVNLIRDNPNTAKYIRMGATAATMAATAAGYKVFKNIQINKFIDKLAYNIKAGPEATKLYIAFIKDVNQQLTPTINKLLPKLIDKSLKPLDFTFELEKLFDPLVEAEKYRKLFGPASDGLREATQNSFTTSATDFAEQVARNNWKRGFTSEVRFNFANAKSGELSLNASAVDIKLGEIKVTEDVKIASKYTEEVLTPENNEYLTKVLKKVVNGDGKNITELMKSRTYEELAKNTPEENKIVKKMFTEMAEELKSSSASTASTIEKSILSQVVEAVDIANDFKRGEEAEKVAIGAKELNLTRFASKLAGGFAFAEFAVGTFGVQAIIDAATLPPGQGFYDTGIASFKWTEVTSAEAQNWNAKHSDPEQQIKANTKVVEQSSNGDYSNSLVQTVQLSYNDNATGDLQKILRIENTYVSTPFMRVSDKVDPWFGNITRGEWSEGNALIKTDISEITATPGFMQQVQRDAFKTAFGSSNIVPVISAPQLTKQPALSMLNNVSTSGQLTSRGLLSSQPLSLLKFKKKTKLRGSVGYFEGYILPENSKLSFPMKVANTTGFNDMIYSQGLTSEYVSANSGFSNLKLAKTMVGYNNLLGALPALYSAYTCKAPYIYGQTCNYEVALTRGLNATTKEAGVVYLSDMNGEQLPLNIFVGYNLILDQQHIDVIPSRQPIATFAAKVAMPGGYDKLILANLPEGAKLLSSSCGDKPVTYGAECSFKVDFSNVDADTYPMKVMGISKDGQIKDNDGNLKRWTNQRQ